MAQWLACMTHVENVVGSSLGLSLVLQTNTNVPLSAQVYLVNSCEHRVYASRPGVNLKSTE